MAGEITAEHIKAIQKNLAQFGYSGLTVEHVREQIDKVLAGEKTGIIGMFAKKMLVEAGLIDED
jgi:hypothetical protein